MPAQLFLAALRLLLLLLMMMFLLASVTALLLLMFGGAGAAGAAAACSCCYYSRCVRVAFVGAVWFCFSRSLAFFCNRVGGSACLRQDSPSCRSGVCCPTPPSPFPRRASYPLCYHTPSPAAQGLSAAVLRSGSPSSFRIRVQQGKVFLR